jgi:hypothetical protein
MKSANHSHKRRTLLKLGVASPLLLINPRYSGSSFELIRSANAHPALIAMQIAITAMTMFADSPSGLGAFLGALKKLSEENIKLTRKVLEELATIKARINEFPDVVQRLLLKGVEDEIRVSSQEALDYYQNVELNNNGDQLSSSAIADLREAIKLCRRAAGYRVIDAGRGSVAAICAPVIVSIEMRSRRLLGEQDLLPSIISNIYLPWFDEILGNKTNSLAFLMEEGHRSIGDYVAKLSSRVTGESAHWVYRDVGKLVVDAALQTESKSYSKETCIGYTKITGYTIKCYASDGKGNCVDRRIEQVHTSRTPYQSSLVLTVDTGFLPDGTSNERGPGPYIDITSKLIETNVGGEACTVEARTDVTGEQQPHKAIAESEEWRLLQSSATSLRIEFVNPISATRNAVYGLYRITKATRSARKSLANYPGVKV